MAENQKAQGLHHTTQHRKEDEAERESASPSKLTKQQLTLLKQFEEKNTNQAPEDMSNEEEEAESNKDVINAQGGNNVGHPNPDWLSQSRDTKEKNVYHGDAGFQENREAVEGDVLSGDGESAHLDQQSSNEFEVDGTGEFDSRSYA